MYSDWSCGLADWILLRPESHDSTAHPLDVASTRRQYISSLVKIRRSCPADRSTVPYWLFWTSFVFSWQRQVMWRSFQKCNVHILLFLRIFQTFDIVVRISSQCLKVICLTWNWCNPKLRLNNDLCLYLYVRAYLEKISLKQPIIQSVACLGLN